MQARKGPRPQAYTRNWLSGWFRQPVSSPLSSQRRPAADHVGPIRPVSLARPTRAASQAVRSGWPSGRTGQYERPSVKPIVRQYATSGPTSGVESSSTRSPLPPCTFTLTRETDGGEGEPHPLPAPPLSPLPPRPGLAGSGVGSAAVVPGTGVGVGWGAGAVGMSEAASGSGVRERSPGPLSPLHAHSNASNAAEGTSRSLIPGGTLTHAAGAVKGRGGYLSTKTSPQTPLAMQAW